MEVIRQAKAEDVPSLLELAKTGNYINLPPFEDRIRQIVESSEACFARAATEHGPAEPYDRSKDRYVFVVDDGTGRCVGTSAIRAGMGSAEHPNLSFQILRVVRRSQVLRKEDGGKPIVSGEIEHYYAALFQDTLSPTELGGNVLHPDMRSRGIGKLLSYSRFHYLRAHAPWFSDRLLAEMMAPIDPYNDGNPFWRHVARPFIGLTYENADRLSTRDESREFMYSLLPRILNLSLLSEVVLDSIGQVGPYTKSAEGMLRALGFVDSHRVDPFDGGTHLETKLSAIEALPAAGAPVIEIVPRVEPAVDSILSVDGSMGFRAVRAKADVKPEGVVVSESAAKALGVGRGNTVRVSRLDFEPAGQPKRGQGVPTINVADVRRDLQKNNPEAAKSSMSLNEFATIVQNELDKIRESLRDRQRGD